MKARDVMNYPVISVVPQTEIRDLCKILVEHSIGGVPVLDDAGRLCGIVTQTDVVKAQMLAYGSDPMAMEIRSLLVGNVGAPEDSELKRSFRTVGEIMQEDVATVSPEDSLREVARLMCSRHIHRVPVVEDGCVVGLISAFDVLRGVARTRIAS